MEVESNSQVENRADNSQNPSMVKKKFKINLLIFLSLLIIIPVVLIFFYLLNIVSSPKPIYPALSISLTKDIALIYNDDFKKINATVPESRGLSLPDTSYTYISWLGNSTKIKINIGYDFENDLKGTPKYFFSTTPLGKYVVRVSNNKIEIADSTNPTVFRTVVNCSCGFLNQYKGSKIPKGDYVFSEDESAIAYRAFNGNSYTNLFVNDLNRNTTQIRISNPGYLTAFDSRNRRIALGSFGINWGGPQPMHPRVIYYDAQGHVVKTINSNNWDFLDVFSNDFKYVYMSVSTTNSDWDHSLVYRYNFEASKNENLLEIPGRGNYIGYLSLSPTGNKMSFTVTNNDTNSNTLYIINIKDNSTIKKNLGPNLQPKPGVELWSPDEKYLYLENGGSGYIFNINTQELSKMFEGYTATDSATQEHQRYVDFIGWLAKY